jgi:hypothetical protein
MRKTRSRRRPGKRSGRKRVLLPLAVALVAASAVYAFTASITIGSTVQAGAGITTPVTPTVTSLQFTYDSTKPSNVNTAALTFSTSVTDVQAQLGGSWTTCSGSGTSWTCTWGGISVATIAGNTAFKVVAT